MIAPRVVEAGFQEPPASLQGLSVDQRIYESWMSYLVQTLGWDRNLAHSRAMIDVVRVRARQLVADLSKTGWPLRGMRIIDVGSGHGTLAIELACAGAQVTALEPCEAWRALSKERAVALGLRIKHVNSTAEAIPFKSATFDGCVSLQVLEHVQHPEKAIAEIARVLRNEGYFCVTSENYLAFREQHYAVPWLPLLSKPLGTAYLRLLGRDPTFLNEHVTYITWPRLAVWFLNHGLVDRSWEKYLNPDLAIASRKARLAYAVLRWLCDDRTARFSLICLANRRRLFRIGFGASGQKRSIAL